MEKQKNIPALRFPEFKDEWERKKLGKVADIYDGTHQTPNYVDSGVKFVSVENINDIVNTDKFITKEAFDKEYKIKPKDGDILMTRITAGIIGATAIVKNNEPLGYYVSLALIRIKNHFDVNFLCQRIESNEFKNELHKRIIHVAFPKKINLGDISDCEVAYPNLPEQQKISAFLAEVDNKLQRLKQMKTLLEEYKKGTMQKIFSQELRFKDDKGKDFPDWEKKKLGEIARITTGSSNRQDSNLEGEYTFFDRSQDIRSSDKFLFDAEAVIVPGEGQEFIPKYFVGKFDLHQRTYAIMGFKNQHGKFLFYSISYNSNHLNSHAVGSTVKSLRLPMFEKMPIYLPCFQEQTKIANFLSAIDEKINTCKAKKEKIEQYKKGLLQNMFC
jgi:type I restriction enzyme, S subunit